ncbi:MAG: hypothetical protein WCD47_12215 [Candidatus Sulfotelmatobacter sp.]
MLAPHSDQTAQNPTVVGVQTREVEYDVFSLQNGTLTLMVGNSQLQGTKIAVLESNPTNPNSGICGWTAGSILNQQLTCQELGGTYTDNYTVGTTGNNTVLQQFFADRGQVQVFWPNPAPTWYGAWGTPSSTPPGFQPNQTASVTTGWAVITQINVNIKAATACPSGCDTTPAQAGPPSQ